MSTARRTWSPATRWVAHGSADIIDNISVYPTLAEALHDVDFTVATTARSRAKFHYYATPAELLPLLQEKSQWMNHAALVFGREDSGLTNEELALADVLTGVPMVADYPSLQFRAGGNGVLLSISRLNATTGETNRGRLTRLNCRRYAHAFRSYWRRLDVADDIKLADWLQQRLGLSGQRDTAMLHRLLHDIEKNITK
ncbi:putative RNA methyltransferase [Citrobacter koseri]|uniref:Putative RNA methyltransferase n=1 Tax=Citrobacter koseri TaxID=545 RepID=A0A2X2VRB7_CITKO|nr:putative RNA methyltransferase [Citrobacter koseri]